jgi:ribosomal protein S27AE
MDDQILKKLERRVNRRTFLRGSSLAAAAAIGIAAFPIGSAAQDPRDEKKPEDRRKPDQQEPDKKDDKPIEEDEFKITRKDERGRDYRTCPQCGFHMYKQDRTWTCENCGYSYTE